MNCHNPPSYGEENGINDLEIITSCLGGNLWKVNLCCRKLGGGYKHIISLGSFCSPALEIERLGYRDGSYPFDWALSPTISNVIELIETNFKDLFEIDYIYQWNDRLSTYENKKCDIIFMHDFSEWESFEQQLPEVISKYQRRIQRFYTAISEKTLFVRYIETVQEYDYIEKNYSMIMQVLRKYNTDNNIIFIANNGIHDKQNTIDNVLFVDKDDNDTVARRFTEKLPELIDVLDNAFYSDEKKEDNLRFYKKKHRFDVVKKYQRKTRKAIKILTQRPYQYCKQI